MQIVVVLEGDAAKKAIATMKRSALDLTPAMKQIGEYYLLTIDTRFREQAGADGPWKPLNPRYRRYKLRRKGIDKILQFRGLMRASINYQAGRNTVKIGSDKIYAARQERDRSFLKPSDADKQEFINILRDHLKPK